LQLYDDGTAYYLGNSENHYLILVSVISKEITSFTIYLEQCLLRM
jgi:hypothetical protein